MISKKIEEALNMQIMEESMPHVLFGPWHHGAMQNAYPGARPFCIVIPTKKENMPKN